MNQKDLVKIFGAEVFEESEHNPLQIAEQIEFRRPKSVISPKKDTYQQRAIQRVVQQKLPFCSTWNSFWDLMKQFVKVTCPYCDGDTVYKNGGGSGNSLYIVYGCTKCTAEVVLNMNAEGFSVRP